MNVSKHSAATSIEAPPDLPVIVLTRDFAATPAQLHRAHTDPDIFAKWVGPSRLSTEILRWDATTGGHWQYVARDGEDEFRFHGSFHDVLPERIVQTFTYDDWPDSVSLETVTFQDLGDGRTRLRARSVWETFEARDAMVASGMDSGINDGYAKLDELIAGGEL